MTYQLMFFTQIQLFHFVKIQSNSHVFQCRIFACMCLVIAIYDRLSLFSQEGFGYVQKESSFHPHVSVVDEETEIMIELDH